MADKGVLASYTISCFGGKNVTGQLGTVTIADVSSDDIMRRYMEMFTEFKVIGLRH